MGHRSRRLKIHKAFDRLPKFRPIIDTTGTTHFSVGKFISELLQPLTQNEYTLKDTFDAANRIKAISPALFAEGYTFVSFDVESLFTNVPLQRTLKIIEDRTYNKKLVKTKLKKSTLRKLIRDTCTKTVFSCKNKLYEQTDGVSMGGSLGPVLANIIMTEFEQETVNKLINQGLIAFYCRYVDDTLLLIKRQRNTITTILERNTFTSLIEISALPLIRVFTKLIIAVSRFRELWPGSYSCFQLSFRD